MIPQRILKFEEYILQENHKEQLEIIIFKGFSSSTTHPIEINLEKKAIKFTYLLTKYKLYEAPLNKTKDNFIRDHQNINFFLNKENWI